MEFRLKLLMVISAYTRRNNTPPSLRYLAKATNLSLTALRYQIVKLEEEGYIVRSPDHRRLIYVRGAE